MAAESVIRRARPADVASLVGLCIEHAAFEGVALGQGPNNAALHAALFGATPPLVCWVADSGGEIIGYATATREFSTWQTAYYLHMDCLYLKPDARNRGLGEALVRALASDGLRLRCEGMQWQTPSTNLKAAAFYRRIGAQSKDKLRFYLSDVDTRRLADG